MYPRNAASPPRIAIGAVVQISDGAVQASGVSVAVRPEGGAESAGGGTVSYGGSSGIVYYAPTQAETDYTAFAVVAYKSGCIPVSAMVITTDSASPGTVKLAPVTHTSAVVPTVSTLTGHTPQTGDSFARLGAPVGASISDDVAAVKTQAAAIEVDTQDIQSRLPAALVSGRMDSSLGAVASGVDFSATMKASINAEADTALSDVGLTTTVTGRIDVAVSTRLAGASYTAPASAASIAEAMFNYDTGETEASAVAGSVVFEIVQNAGGGSAPTASEVADEVQTRTIAAVTVVGAVATGGITAAAVHADAADKIADALLNRDLAAGTDSGSPTVRTVRQALRALRNKWTNLLGAYTVYKEDDTTPSWTSTVATDAAAQPITGSDPA